MAEIDSLDIKISAEASKANTAIDSLVKNLEKLANSLKIDTSGLEKLGKIDGSNFQKLGEGIKDLSSGLKNLQNVKKSDFNRLASGIERLSTIPTGNMQAVSSTLKPLADGVSILSNANFDNKNLQGMINSLTRLSNSNVSNLSNVDFSGIGNSLRNLTDSLAGAEKVQQSTISMTNAIAKLADSGANIPIVSSSLSQLGSSLKGFMTTMSGAPAVTAQTTAFTQAIAQLSNAGNKVATTASNLGTLATELKAFMKTMSNAPAVSDSTIKMTQALANLASQGNKTGNATKGIQAVFSSTESIGNKFNNSIKKLSSSMKGLGDSVKKTASKMKSFKTELLSAFGVVGGLYGAIRGIQKSIDISSDLVEVQNVVDTTFKDMSYKVEELAKTSIEQFGLSELSLKQFSSRFQAMGTAMGFPISQMSDMSIELTKLTADMSSFYNVAQEDVSRSLQSIFTGETEPLRKYGLDLTQATLQEWALKQGLDADMRSMSQAEKTMLRYQYVLANTKAAQGDFAKTANTWANQIRILRQQFEQLASIIGTAFVNMLKPVVQALNKAMAKVIEFAQTVINALGKIFGWKFEINTKGIAGDFSGVEDGIGGITDGIEDATEASKKFNKQLQGFDKLNNLTTSDAGKDLEGFGAGLGNIGDIVPGEGILDKYESDIDTLYKLGKYLGETLKNFLDNIPWDAIKKKAREIGEGIADLINGFIEVDGLGYSIGKSLIEAVNTGFELLNAFVHRLHWESVGHFIADTLNGFFENIDWELIRDTFVTGFKGLADAINQFIADFHWDNISNTISNAINIIAETVYTFFSTVNWDELGRNLGNQLMETIRKIDWEKVGMALGSVLQSAFDFLKSFIGQMDLSDIASALGDLLKGFFKEVDTGDLATAITLVLGTAFAKISFKAIIEKIKIDIFANTLAKAFGSAGASSGASLIKGISGVWSSLGGLGGILTTDLSTIMGAGTAAEIGLTIGTGIIGGLFGAFVGGEIGVLVNKYILAPLYEAFGDEELANIARNSKLFGDDGFLSQIKDSFTDGSWKRALDLWAQDINDGLDALFGIETEPFYKTMEEIKSSFNDGSWKEALDLWGEDIKTSWAEIWGYVKEDWNNSIIGEVLGSFTDGTWREALDLWAQDIKSSWENIKTDTSRKWEDIKGTIRGAIEKIKGFFKFEWSLPKIKLPHFKITGSFSLNPPKVPSIGVDWYAKGGLFKTANVVGIGEAGAEAVLPLTNRRTMGMIADSIMSQYNSYSESGYNTTIVDEYSSGTASELRQQNKLLQKQNELLQAILEKPIISDGDIYDSFQSSYQSEAKRKGVTSIDPVLA